MDCPSQIIFRNDDVNYNTNPHKLGQIYGTIHRYFPNAEIWSVVSVFGGKNSIGAVYGDLPLKDKDINWFYKHVDCFMPYTVANIGKIASHGLFHIDHSIVSRQTQEMSILSSCAYLKTNIFIPPFNRYNQDTLDICFDNNINCYIKGWKSMDFEPFNLKHRLWYMHSWRWTADKLKEYFDGHLRSTENSADLGQLQKPTSNGSARIQP